MADLDLFIEMAGVAGVFVGFGALISATSDDGLTNMHLGQIRTVVTTGLMVIVAALIPLALNRYGLSGHRLWFISSFIFLAVSWASIGLALGRTENREVARNQIRSSLIATLFFWLLLELPVHVSLLLILFGVAARIEPALYLTALIFNLLQAAFVLTQFVYAQEKT